MMLRSTTDRRLYMAIRTSSRSNHTDQTLLLDQIHRNLFLPECALDALILLDGLVSKTPLGSGFHSVLLQHPILDEILNLVSRDVESQAGRYAIDMMGAWRHSTYMMDWAQAHYDLVAPLNNHPDTNSDIQSNSSEQFDKWFVKFHADLLDAVQYITTGDIDNIRIIQNRIVACLDEIDQEQLVNILLLVNDLAQTALDQDPSPVIDDRIDDIRSRISSLYNNSGQIWTDSKSDCSLKSDRDGRAEIPDFVTGQDQVLAMFQSIALRDQTTNLESGLAGSKDDIIERFDPVFGDSYQ